AGKLARNRPTRSSVLPAQFTGGKSSRIESSAWCLQKAELAAEFAGEVSRLRLFSGLQLVYRRREVHEVRSLAELEQQPAGGAHAVGATEGGWVRTTRSLVALVAML